MPTQPLIVAPNVPVLSPALTRLAFIIAPLLRSINVQFPMAPSLLHRSTKQEGRFLTLSKTGNAVVQLKPRIVLRVDLTVEALTVLLPRQHCILPACRPYRTKLKPEALAPEDATLAHIYILLLTVTQLPLSEVIPILPRKTTEP